MSDLKNTKLILMISRVSLWFFSFSYETSTKEQLFYCTCHKSMTSGAAVITRVTMSNDAK